MDIKNVDISLENLKFETHKDCLFCFQVNRNLNTDVAFLPDYKVYNLIPALDNIRPLGDRSKDHKIGMMLSPNTLEAWLVELDRLGYIPEIEILSNPPTKISECVIMPESVGCFMFLVENAIHRRSIGRTAVWLDYYKRVPVNVWCEHPSLSIEGECVDIPALTNGMYRMEGKTENSFWIAQYMHNPNGSWDTLIEAAYKCTHNKFGMYHMRSILQKAYIGTSELDVQEVLLTEMEELNEHLGFEDEK